MVNTAISEGVGEFASLLVTELAGSVYIRVICEDSFFARAVKVFLGGRRE